MLIISLVCFFITLAVIVELGVGYLKLLSLDTYLPDPITSARVSVIVPACNEAHTIESGLRSLAGQNYENLEIIVVNDRSTDGTQQVIERVRDEYPKIQSLEIKSLPSGWLGKPHALQKGAEMATGEYLIFTDADVQFEETTISRAVTALETENLDHLTLIFKNSSGGALLNAIVGDIGAGLIWLIKPWQAKKRNGRFSVGVGAFNMVRGSAYQAVGMHEQVRMQVIDDLFLGKIIKRQGFSQDCLLAQDFLSVPWYPSVGQLVSGLMKNVFAFFNYRLPYVMVGLMGLFFVLLLPYFGVLFGSGPARLFFLLTIAIRCIGIGHGMIRSGVEKTAALWLLLTPFITVAIIVRATAISLINGGITWRGSFYPLGELKKKEWVLSGIFRLF